MLSDQAGGIGYLLKQRIADVVAVMVSRARRSDSAVGGLTARQREVLGLMAEGRSNGSIAQRLFLTEKAVVQHTSRIYDALSLAVHSDAHRRVLAVLAHLNRD